MLQLKCNYHLQNNLKLHQYIKCLEDNSECEALKSDIEKTRNVINDIEVEFVINI